MPRSEHGFPTPNQVAEQRRERHVYVVDWATMIRYHARQIAVGASEGLDIGVGAITPSSGDDAAANYYDTWGLYSPTGSVHVTWLHCDPSSKGIVEVRRCDAQGVMTVYDRFGSIISMQAFA